MPSRFWCGGSLVTRCVCVFVYVAAYVCRYMCPQTQIISHDITKTYIGEVVLEDIMKIFSRMFKEEVKPHMYNYENFGRQVKCALICICFPQASPDKACLQLLELDNNRIPQCVGGCCCVTTQCLAWCQACLRCDILT